MAITSDTSSALTGKQAELQKRDEIHLQIAREIFLNEGYHELSMSRLAKATGFSRPTLYERFQSKEILLIELAFRVQTNWLQYMQRAADFPGRPRERLVALGKVVLHFSELHANDMAILRFASSKAVLEKIPPHLQLKRSELDKALFDVIKEVIDDGEREGDLAFRRGFNSSTLALSLIAMFDGLGLILQGSVPLDLVGISNPVVAITTNVHMLLDGHGWQPLYDEWDYKEVEQRISALVIEEMKKDLPVGDK